MSQIQVQRMTCARIPTDVGEFQLCYYQNNRDEKEHLALILGNIEHQADVLVRIHSECFTGDVLGSLRCDCGSQLRRAMQLVAEEGRGIIIYLRQEGRGIGLLDKLRAYNLQDMGYDTVDANLMLGHQADARDYTIAALILKDLGVRSLRLLTNNPSKIEGLDELGVHVSRRVALPAALNAENAAYLSTKVNRMRHLLNLEATAVTQPYTNGHAKSFSSQQLKTTAQPNGRPAVTLSYAQSLDGSITTRRGQPLAISGPQSMAFTHRLRADHDAILIGIGTLLADDPRLTVRLVDGPQPQPIIVDSRLRFPLKARLTAEGARIFRLPVDEEGGNGRIHLPSLLATLHQLGIRSLMVEGGARIITSFLAERLVDRLIVTVAPMLVGGLNAVGNLGHLNGHGFPRLRNPHTQWLGQDMVLSGNVIWQDENHSSI